MEKDLLTGASKRDKARAAYLAICLDLAPELKQRSPERWSEAIQSLVGFSRVLHVMFYESSIPSGESIRQKALAAGVNKPTQKIPM